MAYYYRIKIAGKELHFKFHYLETIQYFRNCIEESLDENAISVKKRDFVEW